MQNLWKKMSPQDKHLFNFDITLVDWEEAIFAAVRGLRLYVMEDPFVHIEEEVTRYKRCVYLQFEILMAVTMKNSVFWDVKSCNLVQINFCFHGIFCFHLQGRRVNHLRKCEKGIV
jgi:hypothetical protein